MNNSAHSVSTALGALLTLLASACESDSSSTPSIDDEVQALVVRSEASNAALMAGDVARYGALVELGDDFTLMSPFGGPITGRPTPERMQAIGTFFRNGSHAQELVHAYRTQDMVVLALIERSRVEVGGLAAQDWSLRVTLVYRRDGDDWTLVHRHADPLVAPVSLPQAASLARGERMGG